MGFNKGPENIFCTQFLETTSEFFWSNLKLVFDRANRISMKKKKKDGENSRLCLSLNITNCWSLLQISFGKMKTHLVK